MHVRIVAAKGEKRFQFRTNPVSGTGFGSAPVIGKVKKRLGITPGCAHGAGRRWRSLFNGLVCGSHGFSRSCFLRENDMPGDLPTRTGRYHRVYRTATERAAFLRALSPELRKFHRPRPA